MLGASDDRSYIWKVILGGITATQKTLCLRTHVPPAGASRWWHIYGLPYELAHVHTYLLRTRWSDIGNISHNKCTILVELEHKEETAQFHTVSPSVILRLG